MDARLRRVLRGVAAVAVAGLTAACTGPAQTPATPTASARSPSPTALDTKAIEDVVFAPAEGTREGRLDVLYPSSPGPWPVVVMFHGAVGGKAGVATHAWYVARQGFVVFVPNWSIAVGGDSTIAPHVQAEAKMADAACAVSFAVEQAGTYGGDPNRVIVFGYSAGATPASIVTFARTLPRPDCLATAAVDPDVLVTLEGDWLLVGLPEYSALVQSDPLFFDSMTPWSSISRRPELPVIVLVTAGGGPGGPAAEALGPDGWLAARDPDGAFLAALQSAGAFDDGDLDVADLQRLFADRLRSIGNLVSYDTLADSSHDILAGKGWDDFINAFVRAAAHIE